MKQNQFPKNKTIQDLNDEEIKEYANSLSLLTNMNFVETTSKLFMLRDAYGHTNTNGSSKTT